MTTISIFPADPGYRAVCDGAEATGPTIGQALDRLTDQLPKTTALVVIQPMTGDEFFSDDQRHRLTELMAAWRTARDAGGRLPADEQAELDGLIDAELDAATARTAARSRATP